VEVPIYSDSYNAHSLYESGGSANRCQGIVDDASVCASGSDSSDMVEVVNVFECYDARRLFDNGGSAK